MKSYLFIKEINMCPSCTKHTQKQHLGAEPAFVSPAGDYRQAADEKHRAPTKAMDFATELRKIFANLAGF
jgi:hypothetical protein